MRLLVLFLSCISLSVLADADPNLWALVKEAHFDKRPLLEANFLRLEAPRRAESGAQVPIAIHYDKQAAAGVSIKKMYLFIDANPVPLASTYHLFNVADNFQLSTRIRMETDAFIHVVGEASDGKLYTSAIQVRASGGVADQ